jgi:hypothetical protein
MAQENMVLARHWKMLLAHTKWKKEQYRRSKLTSLHSIMNVHIYSLVNLITSLCFSNGGEKECI